MAKRRYDSLEHAFRTGFEQRGDDECWVWTRHVHAKRKYGGLIYNKKWYVPSRVSWTLHNRGYPIPAGMFVCHRCDNPPCVNPGHLFLGTHKDNMADMVAKGRSARTTKLTSLEVEAIRIRVSLGQSYGDLGRFYGVVHETIRQIALGKTWAGVAR